MAQSKQKSMGQGLTILYVGDGKGKTTAAMGIAVRALGTGFNVLTLQFVKGEWPTGERDFAEVFKEMKVPANKMLGRWDFKALGRGFVKILGDKKPIEVHKKAAAEGLKELRAAMRLGKYQVIIADELLSAYESKLISLDDIVKIIRAKPRPLHLVITGHRLPPRLKAHVDLISEMKMVKHPYNQGILAQRGIDY